MVRFFVYIITLGEGMVIACSTKVTAHRLHSIFLADSSF